MINLVEKFQKETVISPSSKEHAQALEEYLSENGCIGKRKPTAVTTGAKNSYMRDEMKLWNKLGFLYANGKASYFFPDEGYKFNWERITEVLISGSEK